MATDQREQHVIAIDIWVKEVISQGGGDEEILESMYDYMGPFKEILDTSSQQEIDAFALKYEGFYRFSKLLEQLASAIADGRIQVP